MQWSPMLMLKLTCIGGETVCWCIATVHALAVVKSCRYYDYIHSMSDGQCDLLVLWIYWIQGAQLLHKSFIVDAGDN